jgi:hypothetical protein
LPSNHQTVNSLLAQRTAFRLRHTEMNCKEFEQKFADILKGISKWRRKTMKNTITKTMLSTILAILIIAISAYSQNNELTPNAVSSFSTWSVPQNMGATLNSASDEQGGFIAPSGLSLYFTSNRPGGQGGQDIYVSQRATLWSAWGAPQNLGATVNSAVNDLAPSLSLDGRLMFLTSDRTGGMGLNDIYLSTRTDPNNDFGWTAPINLDAPISSQFTERGATYFEDPATGNGTLFFAREFDSTSSPFHDLYQSTRNADGTFNAPTLISELNSDGSEIRATVRRDGLEVFIHTVRAGGLSAPPPAPVTFDIFVSTRASTSAPWNPPVFIAGLNTTSTEGGPSLSPDGSVLYFQSNRPGGFGGNDLYSVTRVSVNRSSTADFDGDGRTDLSIFRPSDGTWWVMQSGNNAVSVRQFGAMGDKIVPGDYDGDGRTDFAVFRPSTATWWIQRSSDNSFSTTQWGVSTDKLVPADYDGDGRTDIAVYRDGTWYIIQSSSGITYKYFGLSGDIPVTANMQ